VTLEKPADGQNFNRRYATGTIRAPLPGVETAGLRSAAAHAAKAKIFFQKCTDIRFGLYVCTSQRGEYIAERMRQPVGEVIHIDHYANQTAPHIE
jgi:hypothetical protein